MTVFSLTATSAKGVELPRLERDMAVDEQLGWVQEFLATAQKPAGTDEKGLRQFLNYM